MISYKFWPALDISRIKFAFHLTRVHFCRPTEFLMGHCTLSAHALRLTTTTAAETIMIRNKRKPYKIFPFIVRLLEM